MTYQERARDEALVDHLLRNADALALDAEARRRLQVAYRLSLGTNAQRNEAGRIAVEIRDQLRDDLKVVLAFAQARGERVSTFNDAGAKRIRNRDGLASLHASGALDDAAFNAGLAYRYCHEQASKGLKSGLANAGMVGGGKDYGRDPALGRDKAELHRAYVMARLGQMERAVAKLAKDGNPLIVLRLVAGEGHTINSISANRQRRQNLTDDLRLALAAVATLLPARGLANRAN